MRALLADRSRRRRCGSKSCAANATSGAKGHEPTPSLPPSAPRVGLCDRLDPPALLNKETWPPFLLLFGAVAASQQKHPSFSEPLGELGTPVAPIAQSPTLCTFE